jgi:hypothetical protein
VGPTWAYTSRSAAPANRPNGLWTAGSREEKVLTRGSDAAGAIRARGRLSDAGPSDGAHRTRARLSPDGLVSFPLEPAWSVRSSASHLDARGEWVAELTCGHQQHVRHQPPFPPSTVGLRGRGSTTTPWNGARMPALRSERARTDAICRSGWGGGLPCTSSLSRLRRRPGLQSPPPRLRVRDVSVIAWPTTRVVADLMVRSGSSRVRNHRRALGVELAAEGTADWGDDHAHVLGGLAGLVPADVSAAAVHVALTC